MVVFLFIATLIRSSIHCCLVEDIEKLFFIKEKIVLVKLIRFCILDIVIMLSILFIAINIEFNNIYVIKNVEVVLIFLIIVILCFNAIIQIMNFIKGSFKNIKGQDFLSIAVFLLFMLLGIVNLIEKDISLSMMYQNPLIIIGETIIIATLAILAMIATSKISNDYNKVYSSYWINYKDDNGKIEKYYIFFATDKEFVLCGKNSVYRENNKFKHIKIRDIKENYEINFDNDKNIKNTVDYKFRKKVTYGITNTKNKKI